MIPPHQLNEEIETSPLTPMPLADQYHDVDYSIVEPIRTLRRESFLQEFANSKGPPQIIVLMILLALGFGSTIGVVPAVMTDRYARLNHGYTDATHCSMLLHQELPPGACLRGSADAQNAVATEQFISNLLTFFTSSLFGSLSDEYGRKGMDLRVATV
jgi:hypothetical protein